MRHTACNDIARTESPLVLWYVRLRLHSIVVCANLKCVCDYRMVRYGHSLCIHVLDGESLRGRCATFGGPVVPLERQRKAIFDFPSPGPSLRSTNFTLWARPSWISCSTVTWGASNVAWSMITILSGGRPASLQASVAFFRHWL